MTTVGERLKKTRNNNNYSQTDFAKKLDVSLSAYKSYEINKTSIPHTVLFKIKEMCNISLDWLIMGDAIIGNIEDTFKEYYNDKNKNKYSTVLIDIYKRLLSEIVKLNKEQKNDINKCIENNELEKICKYLNEYYEGIDFQQYYNDNKIPYAIIFFENEMNGLSSDWLLYGIWDTSEINDKTAELRSIIGFYLNDMSPHALEQLKNKLEELRKIEKTFFN